MAGKTRLQIVHEAVGRAGRGSELHSLAKGWLNTILESLATESKYPILRKVGEELTLSAGQSTVDLPSDFGAGSDHLLFSSDRVPMFETPYEEFTKWGGIPASGATSGRPTVYTVDMEAQVFRFNAVADQSYGFLPIYYKRPEAIADNSDGDSEFPWFQDSQALIEKLIAVIYQYTADPREMAQEQKANMLVDKIKRGSLPRQARIQLNPNRFRR